MDKNGKVFHVPHRIFSAGRGMVIPPSHWQRPRPAQTPIVQQATQHRSDVVIVTTSIAIVETYEPYILLFIVFYLKIRRCV